MESTNDSNTNQRNQTEIYGGEYPSQTELKSARRREVEEILRNAAKPGEAQLVLNLKAVVTQEDIASLPPPDDKQNPLLAHKLYYRTLGRLRFRFILHNRERAVPGEARKEFNREIRFFLRKGEPIGDCRMAETKRMAEAINIFVRWMADYPERDVAALYHLFCIANDEIDKLGKRKKKK
jgi:hypothetical protein